MNRKMYWGLGILVTLIISFGAFVFYNQYTQIQHPHEITSEDLAGLTWQQRTDKLYPALKLSSLDWENLTDDEIVTLLNRKEQWNSITQDQRDTVVREFYKRELGMMPPEGYFYVCNPGGSVKLGEDGLPIYYKYGEPVFKIGTRIGFRPTREQIIIHKKLDDLYVDAINNGDQETAETILSEIRALEEQAVGELPLITASTQPPPEGLNRSEWRRKLSERAREEYKKMGIEYVYNYTIKGIVSK